ncbi:PIN domain-containing protein [Pseudokineococcus marinus]|uniref:PIN domain-containing protein n=1 Tax=Pseudokineococcus marinus TaxID=351215 RepID=A0A849BES6_9ACTN|nr:PIN domain-containing protein [Pseudokineococcus marinus]NNH21539.1 PIN domain-containing protein [Pseudokineococcus marinus]
MTDLLDTSVLIGDDPVRNASAVSVISLVELASGINRPGLSPAETRVRRARWTAIESMFAPIPVDRPVLLAYLQVDQAVRSVGRDPRPRRTDLLIAATALAHDLRLLTRNPADFLGLEHLVEVVTP